MHTAAAPRSVIGRACAHAGLALMLVPVLVMLLPGPGVAAPANLTQHTLPAAFDLSDEAFFAPAPDPAWTTQLLDSSFVGVAVRAPQRVDTGRRSSLPLLIASRFDGARDWALPLHDLALLVGIDRATGRVSLARAFADTKRTASASRGAQPSADELRSFGAQVDVVDARSRLGIPWQAACWAFSLVYHDWLSKPVVVRLGPVPQGPSPAHDSSPCAASNPGASQVEFQYRAAVGEAWRVTGRYTVPAGALGAGSTALPATLFIVTSDGNPPQRHDWQIPVVVPPGAVEVSGTVDHRPQASQPPPPGAMAYLVVAGQIHGPRPWAATARPARAGR